MLRRTCLELHRPLVKYIGFEQLSHPPYSPDLTPSDFYLFRHLKQDLRGTRFFWCWWAVAGHGAVSRQPSPGILFDWNKRTFWQMWKVYWCSGRLHWNIMQLFCLCRLYIILNCKTFWSPLVQHVVTGEILYFHVAWNCRPIPTEPLV